MESSLPLAAERPEEAGHPAWLAAASLTAIAWVAWVHARPPGFYLLGSGLCLVWGFLSWKAMGLQARTRLAPRWRDVLPGALLALALLALTRATLRAMCGGFSDALCSHEAEARALSLSAGPLGAAAVLLIIAPAEELFWHGAVHAALRPRLGRLGCTLVSTTLGAGLLFAFGEPSLGLNALGLFLLWGLLTEWRRNLTATLVSHCLWTPLFILSYT
jgi:membrane protease YdiL (CAAX protease family)